MTNQIAEFNFHITYDPTLFSNTFVAQELISNKKIYSSNYLFPDLPELRYLTVCLGCALDENAQPYRYSKINVLNFSLQKITHPPAVPTFMYSDNTITMRCARPPALKSIIEPEIQVRSSSIRSQYR